MVYFVFVFGIVMKNCDGKIIEVFFLVLVLNLSDEFVSVFV